MEKIKKKRLYDQARRAKNKKRENDRVQIWRRANPAAASAHTKRWRDKNRDKYNANAAKWRAKNTNKLLLYSAKYRAAKLEVAFNLTLSDIVIPRRCPILNITLKPSAKHSADSSPTIDRVDPKKGYVKGNVAVMSRKANDFKGIATASQHQKIADWMNNFKRNRR